MVYTLLCLRKHSQQMCFGFGTGVWISLWGLEGVCFIFMGQHLCKFVPDVEGLLQKCSVAMPVFGKPWSERQESPLLAVQGINSQQGGDQTV